ncbi:DUF2625 family protein [Paractinoplanes hotanensis]
MKMSHGEWLAWCLSGDLPKFFNGRLWPGWRQRAESSSTER